jgi:hypothetical protein
MTAQPAELLSAPLIEVVVFEGSWCREIPDLLSWSPYGTYQTLSSGVKKHPYSEYAEDKERTDRHATARQTSGGERL